MSRPSPPPRRGLKYVLRSPRGHIFNPAALALVAAYFLFASGQDWWGALANLPAPFIIVLLASGIFIADRVNKLPMVLVFLGCYLLLFTAFAFARDRRTGRGDLPRAGCQCRALLRPLHADRPAHFADAL